MKHNMAKVLDIIQYGLDNAKLIDKRLGDNGRVFISFDSLEQKVLFQKGVISGIECVKDWIENNVSLQQTNGKNQNRT